MMTNVYHVEKRHQNMKCVLSLKGHVGIIVIILGHMTNAAGVEKRGERRSVIVGTKDECIDVANFAMMMIADNLKR